jgi:quercetin dioxygenase-like cupin family protein
VYDQPATPARAGGTTSGTDVRPARDLRPPQVLDLSAEAATLFEEPEWAGGDRNSRTIATSDRMRITLTALRAGAELGSEGNDDSLAVQVLRGAVRLDVGGAAADVVAGQLATMADPGPWRLRALEDALLLLTVATARRAAHD